MPESVPDPGEDKRLEQEMQDYARALREEFASNQQLGAASQDSEGVPTPDKVEEQSRLLFRKHARAAAMTIINLAADSTSDSVRLSASKYVIAEAFGKTDEEGDPIKDLIAQLTKQPASDHTSHLDTDN